MPPLKTYIYERINDVSVQITIYAYEEISAKWKLEQIVKTPKDFKLTNDL